jgi:hypothetical protein
MPRPPRVKPLTTQDRIQLKVAAEKQAIAEAARVEVVSRVQLVEELERWRNLTLLDFFEVDDAGRMVRLLPLTKMRPDAQRAIRKVRMQTTTTKDGDTQTTIEVDLHDGLKIREMIGKALGLWRDGEIHEHRHIHLHRPLREMSDAELAQEADVLAIDGPQEPEG